MVSLHQDYKNETNRRSMHNLVAQIVGVVLIRSIKTTKPLDYILESIIKK